MIKKDEQFDVIIVGAGLAGLVGAAEIADAGRSVLILDQEGEQNLGGQAFWSLGGLFLVDSPEQRRIGIQDSYELALRDWLNTAGFDRIEDHWPLKWAEAYLQFAAGEKRSWLHQQGIRFFPSVGWAERGGSGASGPGNSVPRFHVTWGTGPGVLAPFLRRVEEHKQNGKIKFCFRHRATGLNFQTGNVTGVHGEVLEMTSVPRGETSSRKVIRDFDYTCTQVLVTTGGIGGNFKRVRENWPTKRLGAVPEFLLSGVPSHVDGDFQASVKAAGASLINADRMWHYTEGIRNWNSIWPHHGIRVLPGPSSLWMSPEGRRLPFPHFPSSNTLDTLSYITNHGYPYTWFLLNRNIIKKEFALSGSEQNPDLTNKDMLLTLGRIGKNIQAPLQAFMDKGSDFVVRDNLSDLVSAMNSLIGNDRVDFNIIESEIKDRDLQVINNFGKDPQLAIIRGARKVLSERLIRISEPSPILDPANGPLIAVRMNILTRKSLGGLETDLDGRVLGAGGTAIPGLYAAGEVSGFGGGGVHGYRSLEGTFLGGCIFSGRTAGRAITKNL